MANIDSETPGLSESTHSEDTGVAGLGVGSQSANLEAGTSSAIIPVGPDTTPEHQAADVGLSVEASTIPRPTIVTTVASGSSSSTGLSAPHPKKFSAVNINKKFLQKNSSSPIASTPISTNSPSLKSGSPAPRPTAQLAAPHSHSRLVTTKLTAAPQTSSTTGAGWSRPSSGNLSTAPSPSPVAANANGLNKDLASTPGAPQLPHAGKVIQPQHRGTAQDNVGGSLKKDGSGKPVWGNLSSSASAAETRTQNDFPTAAEVAIVASSMRKAKLTDAKEAAENAAADKQARSVEADTFRGVHLDPNAHHWDEMEEDDDNFLDGVIEFGDGRQYKIQSADAQGPPLPTPKDNNIVQGVEAPAAPVSKEERFADDFDRSWPRSKTSPAIAPREPLPHPVPISPSSSQATQSPKDASRVLFNERSNRLEPYSNAHPPLRPGPGAAPLPPHRRGSHTDSILPPGDLRGGRDSHPPSQGQGVQLLQKPGPPSDGPTRQGPFGPIASGASTIGKDKPRRQAVPLNTPFGQDSTRPKDQLTPPIISPGIRDFSREFVADTRTRRLSNMGPPPIPSSLQDRSKENGRQLPPHLSQLSPSDLPPQRRPSSREPHPRPPSTAPSDSTSSRRPSFANHPSQSPVLSHGPVASDAPSQITAIPPVDVEKVHKTAMHLSAERAKQRRQQEEEEREKEKERAKLKAAELEEKLKAAATSATSANLVTELKPTDADVTKFLEDAIKDVPPISSRPPSPTVQRPPSLRAIGRRPSDVSRPALFSRPSQSGAPVTSPALEVDSWRSKAKVLPPQPPKVAHAKQHAVASSAPAQPTPPPPMLHGIETLAVEPGEDLEVVDFSDMGKFVGVPEVLLENIPTLANQNPRPQRPVAADFFSDDSPVRDPMSFKSDTGPWRRKSLEEEDHPPSSDPSSVSLQEAVDAASKTNSEVEKIPPHSSLPSEGTSASPGKGRQTLSDIQPTNILTGVASSIPRGEQRPPRGPVYREATMSALDDVMSRIKGALDGMQTNELSKENSNGASEARSPNISPPRPKITPQTTTAFKALQRDPRWVPPALRPQNYDFDQQPQEIFNVTMLEPPRSPKPAWNAFVIRLPKVSLPLKPITKQQYHQHKNPTGPVRWDILSFDPPVQGMNRRDFTVTDVLFHKPPMLKGRRRYIVSLPKLRSTRKTPPAFDNTVAPKVHLPPSPITSRVSNAGAFGRPSGADDRSTWRKSAAPSLAKTESIEADAGLIPISRSPPPELLSNFSQPNAFKSDDTASGRSKPQPKMPAGSAVAFYRGSRVDSIESTPISAVNFTVSSELESGSKPHSGSIPSSPSKVMKFDSSDVTKISPSDTRERAVVELKSQPASPEFVPILVQSKAGSKSSEDSIDRAPITPPSQSANATWTKSPLSFSVKESPARAPDPEHLKAVWSQASNKSRVHSVNSLEGIADDLTALPFTLQDVKSEDGETPPPTNSAAPSRMSLHDVTRAFQQVPSSSSSSSAPRSTPLSPSTTSGPVARPASFNFSLPPPNANMRPAYAPYPSPMMNHSPSPTLIYSHPMTPSPAPSQIPVNGHASMYSQPVWMPGPPNQAHNGMMRPVPSPYPAQLLPYPSPGAPSMYSPHPQPSMANPTSQQAGSAQARGRGMPTMSPAMQHATPHNSMYPGSPVLMHTPGMHGHSYIGSPQAGRGQLRNNPAGPPPMQHMPSNHQPSSHPGYTPVPPNSFVRPNW